jgi:hypothetical protein
LACVAEEGRTLAGVAKNISTFVDPDHTDRVGLLMDIADKEALFSVMNSEAGAAALKFDGVCRQTIVLYWEADRRN